MGAFVQKPMGSQRRNKIKMGTFKSNQIAFEIWCSTYPRGLCTIDTGPH